MSSNIIYPYDDHLLWRDFFNAVYVFSPLLSLAQRLSPLSSACCSALTCLFSSIISHTSQGWSNYSCLCGYIWFSFACRGDTDRAMWIKARWLWTLWLALTLASQVFDMSFSLFFVTDSALDDFVLMHCVFIPNSQLCPALMAQYPFNTVLSNVTQCLFPIFPFQSSETDLKAKKKKSTTLL